jgi:hypothetical protein
MAKKQAFGEDAAKLKESHRKMAKVIVPYKNESGKISYKTAMMDQESVKEYLNANK